MAYAKGSKAFGFCDLTGFRYPLNELVWEIRLGKRTGFRVGKDVVDPDQPQLYLTSQAEANAIWGWNPVWNPLQYAVGSVGTVTVTTT